MRSWTITIEAEEPINVDEVWPDGDAPSDPTAEDVAKVMRQHGPKMRTLHDWMLDVGIVVKVDDVDVWGQP